MGSIFTLTNTQVVGKARKLVLASIKQPVWLKIGRVTETIVIAVSVSKLYYIVSLIVSKCIVIAVSCIYL